MNTNLVFSLVLSVFVSLPFSSNAMSAAAAPTLPASEKLAEKPAAAKHLKKEKRWKKRLARLEKMQNRLTQKAKNGRGSMSLGIIGLFVLVLGGLFVLLGLAIPLVGILFVVIGGIVALVGIILMAILGGISVDTSDSSR